MAQGVLTVPAVRFDGLRAAFDGEVVLDGVTLDVPAGLTTVLIGPSGAGKTTLLRHLLGLYSPDEGAVHLDGRVVADLRRDDLDVARRGMGVLLGGSTVYDASLFGSDPVFENVAAPLRAAGVAAPEADARTWSLLHELGLAPLAQRLPAEVSAGERRRVALARALVNEPPLLVLDDPGPAIDVVNRDAILRAIRRRSAAATCLLVTHDLDVARRLGDRAAVLLGGRIVAAGSIDDVLGGIDDAGAFDARYGVTGAFLATAAEAAAAARRARRAGLLQAWLLMGVLLAIVATLSLVLASGMLDNPAI